MTEDSRIPDSVTEMRSDAVQRNPWYHEDNLRLAMSWIVVISVVAFVLLHALVLTVGTFLYKERAWHPIVFQQLPAMVGLPMAAVASLFVVLILRISAGPIEFEIGPLKFNGGAAPIVFWVLCYLAIAMTIKMTWLPASPLNGGQ